MNKAQNNGVTVSFFEGKQGKLWLTLFILAPLFAVAFAVFAVGSAWVMVWASIASVEIIAFVQRTAPTELCGKVLSVVYMVLSCATPIGQLTYGVAYDRWTPAIVFAGMLAVLTLTLALFYRLRNRLWRLS